MERAGLGVVALLTVLAGVARYVSGVPSVVAFIIAGLALAGGAWIVSFSTEQVGGRFGVATTGMMQSTLGNLPEFFVVLFALQAGQLIVAQTAILGSILVNALLVLGLVLVAGARREPDGLSGIPGLCAGHGNASGVHADHADHLLSPTDCSQHRSGQDLVSQLSHGPTRHGRWVPFAVGNRL